MVLFHNMCMGQDFGFHGADFPLYGVDFLHKKCVIRLTIGYTFSLGGINIEYTFAKNRKNNIVFIVF